MYNKKGEGIKLMYRTEKLQVYAVPTLEHGKRNDWGVKLLDYVLSEHQEKTIKVLQYLGIKIKNYTRS